MSTRLTLKPPRLIDGAVTLPSSKSLSNRALLISALTDGRTEVRNTLECDDTRYMIHALRNLGVNIDRGPDRYVVTGVGGPFSSRAADLYLGNAGTALRPLCAVLSAGVGVYVVSGDDAMARRPIGDLVDALAQLGTKIDYLGSAGVPPLRISANGLRGGDVTVRGDTSSQFLTALLVAAPLASGELHIELQGQLGSRPYVDLTIDTMKRFGVHVDRDGYRHFSVPRGQSYRSPGTILVEGDASSASYFLAAAAIKGGSVEVRGVGAQSIQGDVRLAHLLERMGASVYVGHDLIRVARGTLHGIDVDARDIPDAAMTLAVTALFATGDTIIRNIGSWRVKETDRIKAMSTELRKLGARVVEGEDYIEVGPPNRIHSAVIDTYDDHRMAMCFSLASLGEAEITVNGPECVSKTFPDYFSVLGQLSSG